MSDMGAVLPEELDLDVAPVTDMSAATGSLQATVVRTRQEFDAMAQAWMALENGSSSAVLFQSHAWAKAIFDFEAARGNNDFEPVISALYEHGTLKALLPLERVRSRTRTVLTSLGHGFVQYGDMLLAPGADPKAALSKLLKAATKAAPCDAITLLKVRADSALARGMPANHLVTGTLQGAPYVQLENFPDFASYFATIKTKTRKNMRNDRNRLERQGPVAHQVAKTAEQVRALIERTMQGRADRLKQQGLTSRAFGDSAFFDFCHGLPDQSDLELMAMSLTHNNEPIAEQWGFVHNKRYYAFVASRDFANAESPGKLQLGEIIEVCAARGLVGADLMVPVMPYKLTWATKVVEVTDYALPLTLRGRLILTFWDQKLRPIAKATVMAMPSGIRGLVMKLLGKS
ncbi:GNAT family N-acetyltransferase [Devosia rhodophyticola]|uniref:GNAT family N-acetyltransferase n=1 Tax=Devosia rhodophyticola TaxID=3026423 RepID=A0ABY7Z1P4_9HYPH|nr:GNAT family N-acetyltransferase [Devosia rhodophyticola]WDR07412.1 GNAT family N-acetyltransferase [Devosia rhodophyticola]